MLPWTDKARKASSDVAPRQAPKYDLETVKATLEACTHDLSEEDDRMRTIDSKLTQLAAFSGVSISISAAVGGSVLAAGHLKHGFLIALGSCIGAAACLLLAAVVIAFRALSPKWYRGIDESAPVIRTKPEALVREPSEAIAEIAAGRRDMFLTARKVNDKKAKATTRTFVCAGLGFGLLVAGLLITAVGSVV
jgi:hypothetical protein